MLRIVLSALVVLNVCGLAFWWAEPEVTSAARRQAPTPSCRLLLNLAQRRRPALRSPRPRRRVALCLNHLPSLHRPLQPRCPP